jgi:hypothetical protein
MWRRTASEGGRYKGGEDLRFDLRSFASLRMTRGNSCERTDLQGGHYNKPTPEGTMYRAPT